MEGRKTYYIYVLYLDQKPFYVGSTTNVGNRFTTHLSRTKFTCIKSKRDRKRIMMQIVDRVTTGKRINKNYVLNQEYLWIKKMAKKNPCLENKHRCACWYNSKPGRPYINIFK